MLPSAPAPQTAPAAVPAPEAARDMPPVRNSEIERLKAESGKPEATAEAKNRVSLISWLEEMGFQPGEILKLNGKIDMKGLDTADARIAKVKELTMQEENELLASFGKLLHETGDPHLLTLALARQSTNATPLGRQLRRETIESLQKFNLNKNKASGAPSDAESHALAFKERSKAIAGTHARLYPEDREKNAFHDFAKNHSTDFGEQAVEAIKNNSTDSASIIDEIMGKNSPLALDLWKALSGNDTATTLPIFTPESILDQFGYATDQIPAQKVILQKNIQKAQDAYKKTMEARAHGMTGHMPQLGPLGMGLCGSAALFMLLSSFMSEGEARAPAH